MSSTLAISEFRIGDRVQHVRDRRQIGTVVGDPERIAGRTVVRVRWDLDRQLARVPVDLLVRFEEHADLWGLLRTKAFGGIDDFISNYTHRKLLNPVDDTLYSLHASRTKLLPHQFKPLIRF